MRLPDLLEVIDVSLGKSELELLLWDPGVLVLGGTRGGFLLLFGSKVAWNDLKVEPVDLDDVEALVDSVFTKFCSTVIGTFL